MKKEIKISIIITARNYAKYLKQCLLSCLNQNIKPFEVIYSDDFSEDNSIEIAKSLNVKVITQKKHVGVIKARNAGVDSSKGTVLVHVDGDDLLPKDFLEKHLEVFDENTPFTYCAAKAFGDIDTFWKVPVWGSKSIWHRNYVNTSAMIWKDKFIKAEGWKDTCENTMWDWSLAIRLSRLGTPRKSSAILKYRQHSNSWSSYRRNKETYFNSIISNIRREIVTLSIGLVYSGRIPKLLPIWMDTLIKDINILNNKPELIIINNSEKNITNYINKYNEYFKNIKIITGPGKISHNDERDRRNKVCELLSDNYNQILANATGDLIHLREDDIIPTENSFRDLFYYITDGLNIKTAVAGLYANRNIKHKVVGGYYNTTNPKQYKELDFTNIEDTPFQVDFTGTGFLLFWKDQAPLFEPYIDNIQAHDWAWGLKLKKLGKKLFILPKSICKHYIDLCTFVLPEKNKITPVNNFTKLSIDNRPTKLIKYKKIN